MHSTGISAASTRSRSSPSVALANRPPSHQHRILETRSGARFGTAEVRRSGITYQRSSASTEPERPIGQAPAPTGLCKPLPQRSTPRGDRKCPVPSRGLLGNHLPFGPVARGPSPTTPQGVFLKGTGLAGQIADTRRGSLRYVVSGLADWQIRAGTPREISRRFV